LPNVLQYIQALHENGSLIGQSDRQVLDRFTDANSKGDRVGSELAFAALLERHASMVWQVCRAVVHGAHDAEDAFQATFLILVRKAASVQIDDTLGPWLYVVAYRTALSTRSAAARQQALERTLAALRQRDVDRGQPEAGDRSGAELETDSIVYTEIMRLSDRLRCVVVLCDLEGVSYLEAARRLNLPLGTIQSRLARARRQLRRRLTQQGISSPRGCRSQRWDSALGAVFSATRGSGIPRGIESGLCRLTASVACDPSCLRTMVTGSVQRLIKGGSRSMLLAKLSPTAACLIGGLIASGALFLQTAKSSSSGQDATPDRPQPGQSQAEQPAVNMRTIVIPAPRELRATAGEGKVLLYEHDERGERISGEVPNAGSREVDRDLRWAVLTGVVEHRRIQENLGIRGRSGGDPPPRGGPDRDAVPPDGGVYRRVDLERQTLRKDGSWSDWERVDPNANLNVLDNLPEVEAELTPEEVRNPALVDPLPFLKTGRWVGVDVERFIPARLIEDPLKERGLPAPLPSGAKAKLPVAGGMMGSTGGRRKRRAAQPNPEGAVKKMGGGMMGGNREPGTANRPGVDPPLLMLRTFDFTVEPGRTYRYRARVVVYHRHDRRIDLEGEWSAAADIVTIR
jgi:RNA polymerase sigma factor (sigma-70 family)